MNTRMTPAIAICAAMCMAPLSQALAGIKVAAGDWTIDFSGNVNAFYVQTECDDGLNTAVVGGLACTGDHSASLRNGLLPAALVFSATTREDNYDIDVTVGFYPGINSTAAQGVNGAGQPEALQTPGIDARQIYFTFGDSSWGTVKMGRDIGLFAKDAILDDMTLLGVGTAVGNAAPGNTSLGRIGLGYIYTDWEPQVTYTTPTYKGFSASVGVFQPLDAPGGLDATTPTAWGTGSYNSHDTPQIQLGGSFAWGDPKTDKVTGKVWLDVVTQQAKASQSDIAANAPGASTSITGTAVDAGVKVDAGGFEGVLYGYSGKGVGTTGLYILASSLEGQKRDSDGGYAQATYKINKLKIGLSWGLSELKLADGEVETQNLVKHNESAVVGVYYALTKHINLVGEFINTKSEAWNGNSATEKDFAAGGIIFF